MHTTRSHEFQTRAVEALHDETLRTALGRAKDGFVLKRRLAFDALPEYEQLRDRAVAIKNHTLEHLDHYLERYEQAVIRQGGQVHWAENAEDAQRIVVEICSKAGATSVTKGKSMVGEEMGVNAALEAAGMEVVETDLGEYIIQLAGEPPSHIIAPAVHKTKGQISDLFHEHHAKYGLTKRLTEIPDIVNEARQVLRQKYLDADVGITGANFLIAETGSNIIVTNEGNGDLTNTLPRVHIVTAGIEKVVPTLDDATTLLRLLARSATGQQITSYTTLSTGPRRAGDPDGPAEYHVVLVDNGRSAMLRDEFREMLRCIRCGACMNHCPVYGAIGGHAYGWVYPGPMGSVLTPLTLGLREAKDLPNACTLNGRCAEVCPVRIPLPDLLRTLRHRQFQHQIGTRRARWALGLWSWLARRPGLYHGITRWQARALKWLSGKTGRLKAMPLAGHWFKGGRVLPVPQGETFMDAWRRREKKP
ncbi:iron-sulfur cluster binding protein [Thioalkalivibrio sulfidiphilus HL-EbGr7]|uniref:Iron-sulfur cluster binding protein n=1 Tax=Thioalkalivibrio sulfidiphilus (strain HL-EbGR7) TaxID=396588 RepID=B8GQL0_THISH|nr:LutB/LldF family L-lactate oxidation iron-sulfur protein [Thioalkalivibrio sulfidiphilus]ACL74234.1 iron-sulfur cluster binding protein [Thioalkalivibrio sulfidiphilus HL-EbGr7]